MEAVIRDNGKDFQKLEIKNDHVVNNFFLVLVVEIIGLKLSRLYRKLQPRAYRYHLKPIKICFNQVHLM